MRVALRVDASPEMGTGHLVRCLSLGSALLELGWDVRYVVRRLDDVACRLLDSEPEGRICWLDRPGLPMECVQRKAPRHYSWAAVSAARDAQDSVHVLGEFRPDWVIVDHYAFDAEWHDHVRRALDCRIGAIDDLGDRSLAVHMVIDQNWDPDHEKKYDGRLPANAVRLFGPRFALLSDAYRRDGKYQYSEIIRSIGIFLGGVDEWNYSLMAARACVEVMGFQGVVEIATRTQNPNLPTLEAYCAANPYVTLVLDQPDLADFFARHDLQIGAGGGATWERCRMGVPSVLIACAENQNVVIDIVERLGVAKKVSVVTMEGIAEAVAALIADQDERRRMFSNGTRLVDGLGCLRISLAMSKEQLELHRAKAEDAESTYLWRNAESTRRYFRGEGPVHHDSHIEWWRSSLNRRDRHILLARIGKQAVGVVRFDCSSAADAEVSIYLAPQFTGLGLGRKVLIEACKWVRSEVRTLRRIVADVHPENSMSVKTFLAAGFDRRSDREWTMAVGD